MKKFRKIVTIKYGCLVCWNEFDNKRDAKECGAFPIEEKKFKKGDRVKGMFFRECGSKKYKFEGTITKVEIFPPILDARDRMNFGGVPADMHLYTYCVVYVCPVCKKEKRKYFFSAQIKLVKKIV